jgi:hypothetical protein
MNEFEFIDLKTENYIKNYRYDLPFYIALS